MTKLTSPSEQKRSAGSFGIPFEKYLDMVIELDKDINSVCIRLDEEGNEYWELNKEETQQLIQKLENVAKELK